MGTVKISGKKAKSKPNTFDIFIKKFRFSIKKKFHFNVLDDSQ